LGGYLRMGDDNNIFDDKPLTEFGTRGSSNDRRLSNPLADSRAQLGRKESQFVASQLSYQDSGGERPVTNITDVQNSDRTALRGASSTVGPMDSTYDGGSASSPKVANVDQKPSSAPASIKTGDNLSFDSNNSFTQGNGDNSVATQYGQEPNDSQNTRQQLDDLNQNNVAPEIQPVNHGISNNSAQSWANPPAPRGNYDDNNIAPARQQTYEESVASANNAIQSTDSTKTKKRHSVVIKIILILLTLGLISGIAIGAYFYIKITTSPKYIVGNSFKNTAQQKTDISFLYQVKNGNVYDDKLLIDEQYDGGGNKSNLVTLNLDDSRVVSLNLTNYQSKNYLKLNGLQNSSSYFQSYSEYLSKIINSSGVVLDGQWVELEADQNIKLPTDAVGWVTSLSEAVDLDSIQFDSKKDQIATYNFKFNRDKFNNAIKTVINDKEFASADSFNFKTTISDFLDKNDINKLKFKVDVNQKTKFLNRIMISDDSQSQILNLSLKPHQNKTVEMPVQVKSYSEVMKELQATTSQRGIDVTQILSE
jgi:hypothetical protein